MASVSDLLNPSSHNASPRPPPTPIENEPAPSESAEFAPELFHSESTAESISIKIEETKDIPDVTTAIEIQRRASIVTASDQNDEGSQSPVLLKGSSEKQKKSDLSKKDTRHSSKNEGQHTDRRYLCYLCNKLFTRRRSVRDHISKIHGTKTWEPTRSLEIVVEPETGEPLEPLDDQIAKGGAPPLEKPPPTIKEVKDEDEEEPDDEPPPPIKPDRSVESRSHSVDVVVPAPVIGKKRPLPMNKKGLAKIKTSTPHKRAKITDSETSTPFRSPSVASVPRGPTSKLSRATQSPVSSRAVSIDPSVSPSSSAATPDSTNDDGEIFCICRKGDNHTWMIACDGGCEEWYHGNCVNIRERDGELIDKYICPTCRREGLHTTWKRMCRRKGCRKPAKVFENPPSKYCSRECGRMFFVEFIKKADPDICTTRDGQYIVEMERPKKRKKKRRPTEKKKKVPGDITPIVEGSRPHTPAYSDDEKSEYETDSSLDDDMLPNRGGALRAGEVKALADKCKTIEEWRDLGRKPATPPREPDAMDMDAQYKFDDFETEKLASIERDRTALNKHNDMLNAREKMLEIIKDRSSGITDEVKKSNPKQKDLCGYDNRLAWSDEQFLHWYNEQNGKEILESGKIGAPSPKPSVGTDVNGHGGTNAPLTNGINGTHGHGHGNEDEEDDNDGAQALPTKDGVCIKNRCQRHGSNRWQKAQLAELRFEQDLVRRSIDKLDAQERDIRERGIVRGWEVRAS